MPLDGLMAVPQPNGWTIKVWPTPTILAQARHWSERKRKAFHKLAAAAAYKAIDAIQLNALYQRRAKVNCRGSWARYFFRVDARERRTILVTIYEFHFHDTNPDTDPDPRDGNRSLSPVDLLILNVSGSGRRYSIDYVEGVLPRPPTRNLILSVLDNIKLAGGKLRFARPLPERGNGPLTPAIERINGSIYYSPQSSRKKNLGLDFSPFNQETAIQNMHKIDWSHQLMHALNSIGVFRNGKSKKIVRGNPREMRRLLYNPRNGAYTLVEGGDPALSRLIAHTRSALPKHPLRPRDPQ
jgi:hypothetical protein